MAAAVFALFAIIYSFGGVGGETGLTAAQAHSVTALVKGIGDPVVFFVALVFGMPALYQQRACHDHWHRHASSHWAWPWRLCLAA